MLATENNKQSETNFSIKCEKLLYKNKTAFQKIEIYFNRRKNENASETNSQKFDAFVFC